MVIDRDVWATASLAIQAHGDTARLHAALQSDKLLASGDVEGARTWRRILAAIEQLQSDRPTNSVTAH